MKNKLIKCNIENLTSLWKAVGQASECYQRIENVAWVDVHYSQWPNRLWFGEQVTSADLKFAKQTIEVAAAEITISYMDTMNNLPDFKSIGFEQVSELIGMGMKIEKTFDRSAQIELLPVLNESDSKLWVSLFEQGFGYQISERLLDHAYRDTAFFIVKFQDQMAGTVLLHHSDDVVGIHSLGVIPAMRRKGLARHVMNTALHDAIRQGYEYATLQASAMGKDLYLELGFEEHFLMKNFRLEK